jgi:NitT/TauT family transport system permease protein
MGLAVIENLREQITLFRSDPLDYVKEHPEYTLAPLLFVIVVVSWTLVTDIFDIPTFVLPPPARIVKSLGEGLSMSPLDKRSFYYHLSYTLAEAIFGFVIGSGAGILMGTAVAQSRIIERTLYPYIIAFQSLPKVAIAPLFVIWFGFGMTPKIVVTAIICFFPLLVNTISGIRSVEQERIDLARSLCASSRDIFTKVTFPSALPYIFAGLDMAAVLSMLGAIIGEFVGAQRGMGVLIMNMNFMMNIPGVYAVLVILALIGTGLHLLMRALERRFVFWAAPEVRALGA